MTEVQHIIKYWPVIVAVIGGLALAIASLRYRLPELVKRVETMEGMRAPTSLDHNELVKRIELVEIESNKRPTGKDIDRAVASFNTICKFNQVSCQKCTEAAISQVRLDIDSKLSSLYELINQQAVVIARTDERVAILINKS